VIAGVLHGAAAYGVDSPIGWVAVNALGQNSTTGGGSGAIVHVSTKPSFVTYAGSATPYTVIIDSTADSSWTNTTTVSVKSHKTIIGANAGIVFDGFGLDINTQTNVILRNLTIKNTNPDAIAFRASHHIWIDHCDLSACADGLLDITIGSDYATVSWTKFHDHDKVTLANSGTQHFEDFGRNRVTYHHNWFADSVQRNPRIGYGKGHVFDNYYTNISLYCVGFHTGASVLVESNYFLSSANPLQQSYSTNSWEAAYADARSIGNLFVSCSGTTNGTGTSFDPETFYSYKFATDPTANVSAVVRATAGPLVTGATNLICPTPGSGAIDVLAEAGDLVWTDLEGVTSWDVYFGTTSSPVFQANTLTRTFNPGTLAANTDYYWKVVANRASGNITSEVWRFRTAPTNAAKPFPANGELHAPLRVPEVYTSCKPLELLWTPGLGAVSNRVYLGTNASLTAGDFVGAVTSPVFAPGPLKYGRTYYWRVDTVKSNGTVVAGATWNFKSDITYSGAGKTEAENMVRSSGTYYLENDTGWFPASGGWTVRLEDGPGTLSSVWSSSNSICNVKIAYFDESDGTGWFGFYVNETKVGEWFASANDDKLHTNVLANVPINNGDELRIAAYSNLGELNRTDAMEVEVLAGGPQPPTAPAGLVATPGDSQVWLSWAASSGATGYILKRSTTNGGPYASIVTNSSPSYVNVGLNNGTTYYYVVSATNNAGQSANSAQASVTPLSGTNSGLFAYEGFTYPAGTSIGGKSGGIGWATNWQTFTAANIATNTANGLNYGTLTTSGGALQVGYPQPGVPFDNTTATPERVLPATLGTLASTNAGTLWISFLMYNPMYPTPTGKYYRQSNLGFFSGASGTNAGGSEVAAIGSPNTSATVTTNFAAWGGTVLGAAPVMSTVPSFSTNVQLVVLKLLVDNSTAVDTCYAWFNLNPSTLGNNTNTPNVLAADLSFNGANLSAVNALRFQAGNFNSSGTNAFYTADELRLGASFADVTPAIILPPAQPPILGIRNQSGALFLELTGESGRSLTVQSKTNLSDAWLIWTNLTSSGAMQLLPLPLDSTPRFFRSFAQ
jgi:pectate lyase